MLHRMTQGEQIGVLLDRYSDSIRTAFMAAIAKIASSVVLATIINRLEAGDTYGAIDALHIEPSAFTEFTDQLIAAYRDGGQQAVEALPSFGTDRTPWFDYHAADIAAALTAQAAMVVARIIADTRAGLAQQITAWLSVGVSSSVIAARVVGIKTRATGQRSAGLIGLTSPQMVAAEAARSELLSRDPVQIASYFARKQRAIRFDRKVQAAASAGEAVMSDDVKLLVSLYQANMRRQRADILGKSQALQSINAGVSAAIRQTMLREGIAPDRLTKTWRTRRDDRVRHTHRTLEGNKIAFDHAFLSDSGATLRFPGDPLAPPYETINCRCYLTFGLERD